MLSHCSNQQSVQVKSARDVHQQLVRGLQQEQDLTTGLWKLLLLSLNFFRASFSVCAPLTTVGMAAFPTYSRIVLSWSAVGCSSVTLSSNSCRSMLLWEEWSLAWSSVAVSLALAETCFRRVATLVDAGELALWNKVTMSRGLC